MHAVKVSRDVIPTGARDSRHCGGMQREGDGSGSAPTFSHLYIAFRMYSLDLSAQGRRQDVLR